MDWLGDLDPHWFWLALGLVLATAEIVAPGVFLIWLGAAAALTGLIAWLLPIGIPLQIVIFALLAVLTVFLGNTYVRNNPIPDADPMMNRKGARLVGEIGQVVVPIEGGNGKIKLGDSEWLARGTEAGLGERVRVIGSDGSTLLVEKF